MKNLWKLALVSTLALLAACGGQKPTGNAQIVVDSALTPAQATLPGPEGTPRPLARMVGESGIAMDFVLGELVVSTNDEAKLNAFLGRWGGRVLSQTEALEGAPRTYRVQLNPSGAQVEAILRQLNQNLPDLKGRFATSSPEAAQLLAVALSEANQEKMTVTPNFVVLPAAIPDGTTREAPSSSTPDIPYSPNAFEWTYMNRGSAQDIGVGEAWRLLERAGRTSNKVRILILDSGFAPNGDFPTVRAILGEDWNVRNTTSCGGSPCPWHGTHVVTTAMGQPDNAFGVAGPAGPVGELLAIHSYSDFFGILETLARFVGAAFGSVKIINFSGAFELDLGWDAAVKAACLLLCPAPSEIGDAFATVVSASGKLIFASAGNQGKDVDNGGGIEGSTHMPCELRTVICVGGMGHDRTERDPGSNFGSKRDENSVDIYGPFWVWAGWDPDNAVNQARLIAGTSFSSPFVAGVAALVWAANPSLSAGQVWAILRDTAHVGGVGVRGFERRVNAFAAVSRALEVGTSGPSLTLNARDTADLNREWSITANATDFAGNNCPPVYCPLTFDPSPTRVVGNTAYYRFNTAASRTVQVTARDLLGREGSASRVVNVVNTPPVVRIDSPSNGSSFYRGQTVNLLGTATDLNEGPDPGPGPLACRWEGSAADGFPRTGCNLTVSFSTNGSRTLTLRATDPQGLSSTTSVSITITDPPPNLPPNITTFGPLSPSTPNYSGGFTWDTRFTAPASATDPEGDNPITYIWRATSYRPDNDSVVWRSNVVLSTSTTSGNLDWTPSSNNPSDLLVGHSSSLPGSACYNGQLVRLELVARDSGGRESIRSFASIRIYRCILI
jgi:subtilisin family serine protease